MGAGDDIPTVLKQIGLDVTVIPAEKVASEDLSRYRTIVLGIRAYDTQKDVGANNKKLLDYVSAGGTLIVQYDTGVSDFNSGHLTPTQLNSAGRGFRLRRRRSRFLPRMIRFSIIPIRSRREISTDGCKSADYIS